MRNFLVLSFSALFLFGCTSASQQTVNAPAQNAANTSAQTAQKPATSDSGLVSSHQMERSSSSARPPQNTSSSSMSSPNQQAIDVSEMTAKIEKADKAYKAKSSDPQAKETLAAAYFDRAFALTKAAQYRAALGDFRKGLKLNPNDKEAKDMHDQIISIFESIGREAPKEGEEPPPLPFKKES